MRQERGKQKLWLKRLGDSGDFLGDGGNLLGDGGDFLGDAGDLLSDGGGLIGDGGDLHVGHLIYHHVAHHIHLHVSHLVYMSATTHIRGKTGILRGLQTDRRRYKWYPNVLQRERRNGHKEDIA